MANQNRILVIKLGALGDFVLALSAFAAIRKRHAGARITLLTTRPFVPVAGASPYFDDIWIDDKPGWLQPAGLLRLRRRLQEGKFDRVYDLQTSDRTALYYRLFWPGPKPEWSGIARGCSHPDPTPDRAAVHSFDLRVNQLQAAGIEAVPLADLAWFTANPAHAYGLPKTYVLLAPGCAPHRPEKKWPAMDFAALAIKLAAKGYAPVVIGGEHEIETARFIASTCPAVIDLTTQTSLFDIASLAHGAAAAIGNDTGPMHIVAAIGCPSLVLFSAASRPSHSSPRGRRVVVLQRDRLEDLTVDEVEQAIPFP